VGRWRGSSSREARFRAAHNGFAKRFIGIVLDEFFRVKMREKLQCNQSSSDLHCDLRP